jgi:hypothetical protein
MRGMEEKQSTRSVFVWLVALLTVAALYLLSTGPAVLLRDSGVISRGTFFRIFAPVGWLYKAVPFFQDAMELYLKFWT